MEWTQVDRQLDSGEVSEGGGGGIIALRVGNRLHGDENSAVSCLIGDTRPRHFQITVF